MLENYTKHNRLYNSDLSKSLPTHLIQKALAFGTIKTPILFGLFLLVFLFSNTTFAQGNTCAMSTSLTINGGCATNDNITSTIEDAPFISGCSAGTFRREGWYTFTVTGGPLNITITANSNDGNLFLQLISSTSACTGLAQINCANANNANNTAQTETISTTLNNGIYYVKVVSLKTGGSGDMDLDSLCITGTPVNDTCANATTITSNTTCTPTTGSTIGATDNNETGDCTAGSERAVWYQFTAVATTEVVTVDGISGFDARIGALTTCGTTTRPSGGACTNDTGSGGIETMTLTGLTIGNVYKIQVYDDNGDQTANAFTICVTHTAATPTITSFTATSGCPGDAIVITGTNFTGATDVSFNGTAATYTIDSDTQITATVPASVTDGTISVTTPAATATSTDSFAFITPSVAPTSISGTTTICNGNATTLTLVGGTAGTGATAEWFSGSCGGTSLGSGNSISVSPTSTTDYFVQYSGTCNTTTCASVTVTVNTLSVEPSSISGTTTICNGDSTTLTLVGGTVGTGATAEWFLGSCGGTSLGSGNSISVSPTSTTDYFVRYNGTCNTTNCATTTVFVNPLPLTPADPSSDSPQCLPTGVTLTQTGSAPVDETWYWQTSPSGTSTANSNLTYNVTTTGLNTIYIRSRNNITGCWSSGLGSTTIMVNPLPGIVYTTVICVGTTHGFTPSSGGTWISNNPLIATIDDSGTMTPIAPGIATFTFTDSTTGCSETTTDVTVYALPTVATPTEVCVGETITATSSVTGTWTSNDLTTATIDFNTGVITGVSAGTTTFNFTESFPLPGCSTTTDPVTIKPLPVLGGPSTVCIGDTIALTPNSGGTWVSNDTNIATIDNSTGIVTGVAEGNTTFTFTDAVTGCSKTTSSIVVYSYSIAPTTILGSTTICEGTSTTLTVNGGFEGSGATTEWFSDFCGGTSAGTGNSIVVSPTVSTTYYVNYTGNCNTTTCASVLVTVDPLPVPAGTITGTTPVCQGQNGVVYTVPVITNAIGYVWSLPSGATIVGGGNTNSITVNFANNASSGNITVYGTNCGVGLVSADFPITVDLLPVAAGLISGTATVCQGQTNVTYTVSAIANATNYIWTLPTGASITAGANTNNITVDFSTTALDGEVITVKGNNACGDGVISADYPVTVNPLPIAAGSISGSATVCQGQNGVVFSVPAITYATEYTWTLPIGASIVSGSNTNSITVNFTTNAISGFIRVQGTNACGNGILSAVYPVTVNPLPDAAATISGPAIVCQGQTFVIYTVPVIANATGYIWTLPSGATITAGSNTNTITVDYDLTATTGNMTVIGTNACGNGIISADYLVTVNITPSITINYSPTTCSELPVTVTPTNGGGNIVPLGTTYSWGLPTVTGGITGATALSGQTSFTQTLTNPTNSTQTASYDVTATTGGCSASTFSILVSVYPKPTVSGTPLTQSICSGADISSITFSTPPGFEGPIDYNWSRNNNVSVTGGIGNSGSGDTVSGKLFNVTNSPQTTTFTVIATSQYSCDSVAYTVDVVVNPNPTVTAFPATQSVCSEITIADILMPDPNAVVGTTYSWTRTNTTNLTGIPEASGTSITGILTNITNVPQTTVFTITASANGCALNKTTASVTVNPKPTVDVSSPSQSVCGGTAIAPIMISNPNSVSGTTYSWTRDNNNVSGIIAVGATGTGATISGILVNSTSSDQIVVFTITAKAGTCNSTTTTSTITVKPTPTILITPSTQAKCNSIAITTMNITNPNTVTGTTFTWTRDKLVEVPDSPGMIAASGTGNSISGTLTNTTTSTQTVTFTITATAGNGCSKTSTATVTVYAPLVASVISAAQTVCILSTPAQLTSTLPSGGSGIYTYQWQSSTSSGGPWGNIAGATSINYQPPFIGLGSNDIYYRLRITNTCGIVYSNTIFVEVVSNIGFSFNVDDNLTGSVCSGVSFTPTISSVHLSTSAVRFDWAADSNYILPSTGGPVGTTGNAFIIIRTSSASIGPLTTQNNTNATVTTQISITPSVYNFPGPPSGSFICSVTPQLFNVTIYPTPVATATVPSANYTICSGSSPNISLTGNITDDSMEFEWQRDNITNVSGLNSGTSGVITNPTTTFLLSVGNLTNNTSAIQDVIYTIKPKSSHCNNGTSIYITVKVAPSITPGTVIANQTICSGDDPIAFTETTAATGLNLTYQWQSSIDNITYGDISGAIADTYDAPSGLTVTTWYRRVVTSTVNSTLCSNTSGTPIKITINSINPGAISGSQTVCSPSSSLTITSSSAATGIGTISYQWESSTTDCNSGFSDITLNGTLPSYVIPAGLTTTTYFRRKVFFETTLPLYKNCEAVSNCVTITLNNVTAGTVGIDQTICGNNPAAFTSITPGTSSGSFVYQWQKSTTDCNNGFSNIAGATGATYDAPPGLITTTYYRRQITSTLNGNSCIDYSNCITVTANSVTAGTIEGNRTVCYGGNPTAFTEVIPATGTGLTYQWQYSTTSGAGPWNDISGATNPTYDEPGPIYQVTYYRRIATATVNGTNCSANSNFIVVYVNNVTASLVSGNQTLCSSLDPTAFSQTLAATGTGGLTYQWQSSIIDCSSGFTDIPGALSTTYNPPIISQTTYYRVICTSTLNGILCSAISNCITVTSLAKSWNGSNGNNWSDAGNWTPNGIPNATNCVVIPNVTNDPIISSDALAYSLTILNGGKLVVSTDYAITVTDIVNVNTGGEFLLKSSASLVQINNVANIVAINAIFSMERTTTPMYRYDYTYWGSPLTQASGYTLSDLSPNTLSDKYYSWIPSVSNGNGNWKLETKSTVMNPKKGYIARAPQTFNTNPAFKSTYTAIFTGTPNNGTINADVYCGELGSGTQNDKWNLLGNPYPSALNADKFLLDNTNIEGNVSFWTHGSPILASNPDPFYGNFKYNYSDSDMVTYNFTGSTLPPLGSEMTIASGQGFMVSMLDNCHGDNTTVFFDNSMRNSAHNNSNFYKSANKNTNSTIEKNRIWLSLVDKNKIASTTLLGYIEGATNEKDRLYDAYADIRTSMTIYSLLENRPMTIQGKAIPFDSNDIVPLGMKIVTPGSYKIAIDQLDGLFDSQNIYLEDKLLNTIYDIKQREYDFVSDAGTFNNRFVLRYTNSALSVYNPNAIVEVIALINDEKINIQASENIKKIQIFDIGGKLIKTYFPKNSSRVFIEEFIFADGIYLAKIRLENGTTETKKLAKGVY